MLLHDPSAEARSRRRLRPVRTLLAAGLAVLAVVVLAPLVPGLGDLNPFGSETRDRSAPVLLQSLERLSEYRAASANLQVPVEIERDTVLPSFLAGEKTLLLAAGTVDAAVDFRGLGPEAVRVSGDRRAATITLPSAELSDARVDLARTRVFDTDRGLFTRLADVFDDNADGERRLLLRAQEKLQAAAREDPELRRSAERNTRDMLTSLARGLGFERVDVRFAAPPAR